MNKPNPKTKVSFWSLQNTFAISALLLGITFSFLSWNHLRHIEQIAISTEATKVANEAAHSIEVGIEIHLQELRRIAADWSLREGIPAAEWQADMNNFVTDSRGLLAVAWASADGVVRRTFPMDSRHRWIIGTSLDSDPARHSALEAARLSKTQVISKMVKLLQGGEHGFIAVTPVYRRGRSDGFLVGAFELKGITNAFPRMPGYHLSIIDSSGPLYRQELEGV
ncbi:MAG: hypothetical protein EOP04_01965, partial [Proteobacteria bacterium]